MLHTPPWLVYPSPSDVRSREDATSSVQYWYHMLYKIRNRNQILDIIRPDRLNEDLIIPELSTNRTMLKEELAKGVLAKSMQLRAK